MGVRMRASAAEYKQADFMISYLVRSKLLECSMTWPPMQSTLTASYEYNSSLYRILWIVLIASGWHVRHNKSSSSQAPGVPLHFNHA